MAKRVFLLSMLAVMLSVFGVVLGDTARHITVVSEGNGSTPEEAKAEAIRRALQQAFKQLVVVDRVVSGNKLLRDRVLSTSNGYVEKYEELSSSRDGDGFRVDAKITLSASRIENFVGVVSGSGGEFQGSAIQNELVRRNAQDQAIKAQAIARGKLLDRLFETFPMSAFRFRLLEVEMDPLKTDVITLTIERTVDPRFANALRTTLSALSIFELHDRAELSTRMIDKIYKDKIEKSMPQTPVFLYYPSACLLKEGVHSCYFLDHGAYLLTETDQTRRYWRSAFSGSFTNRNTYWFVGRFVDKGGRSAMKGERCYVFLKTKRTYVQAPETSYLGIGYIATRSDKTDPFWKEARAPEKWEDLWGLRASRRRLFDFSEDPLVFKAVIEDASNVDMSRAENFVAMAMLNLRPGFFGAVLDSRVSGGEEGCGLLDKAVEKFLLESSASRK